MEVNSGDVVEISLNGGVATLRVVSRVGED
jgi:hypothetical protein